MNKWLICTSVLLWVPLLLAADPSDASPQYLFKDFGFSVNAPEGWQVLANEDVTKRYLEVNEKFGHNAEALAKQSLILLTVVPNDYQGEEKHRPTFVCAATFLTGKPDVALNGSRNIFMRYEKSAKISEITSLKQGGLDIANFTVSNQQKDENLKFYSFKSNDKLTICSAGYSGVYKDQAEKFLSSIAKIQPAQ